MMVLPTFRKYKGKVLIIVNTATNCALSDQFEGLETLYQHYKEEGLVILSFPCNNFDNQEPGSIEEIYDTYRQQFGITFPIHSKTDVNGENEHPLYTLLKRENQDYLVHQSNGISLNLSLIEMVKL